MPTYQTSDEERERERWREERDTKTIIRSFSRLITNLLNILSCFPLPANSFPLQQMTIVHR